MADDLKKLEKYKKYQRLLKKKKQKTKRFTILMFLMLLTVNAYAWFIYISHGRFDLSANIVSWDVNFVNESNVVNEIYENIENALPGMKPYKKVIQINNNSDFDVIFKYDLEDFEMFGQSILPDGYESMTTEEIVAYLKERYPFDFSITAAEGNILSGEAGFFEVNFGWDFEDTSKYFKLTDVYEFNPSFEYFRYNNGRYELDESINAANYLANRSNLYLYKDDADSYFGVACPEYVGNTQLSCLSYKILLIVEQVEDTEAE